MTLENAIKLLQKHSGKDQLDLLGMLLTTQDNLKPLLDFLLDTSIVTNLATKKLSKEVTLTPSYTISNFSDFLNYLTYQSKGTDDSIASVQLYAQQNELGMPTELIYSIASKSLKLGVQVKSYNKVLQQLGLPLIKTFEVQLAQTIDKIDGKLEKDEDWLGYFYVTEKLDGVRCISIFNQDKNLWEFFTRNGKQVKGLSKVSQSMQGANLNTNRVFDGELLTANEQDKAEDSFRATMSELAPTNTDKNLIYHIFDTVKTHEFYQDSCTETYSTRRSLLDNYDLKGNAYVVPVLYEGTDLNAVYTLFDLYVKNGAEGLMINVNTVYRTKRVNTLLKVKQFYENDGQIKGFYEGTNSNKGKLGGVTITYKNQVVKVGSGFTQEEREKYWKYPDLILGKIGTYQFTSESHNQEDNTANLRFARWRGLRTDKTELSYDN